MERSGIAVRVQRLVSVDFHFLLRDAHPSLLEVLLAILLSDTEELFPLLLIFPCSSVDSVAINKLHMQEKVNT